MIASAEQLIQPDMQPLWTSGDGESALFLGEAIETLSRIPDESVDCVWTDPPYLLSNGGITCVAGRMVSVDKGDWDKSRGLELDHQFNMEWVAECYRVLKPTGTIWVSGTLHVYPSVGMALLRNGFRLLNDIVWEKPNPPPNLGRRTFTHSTEIVLWASKAPKGSRHKYTFNYDEMRRENGGKQMKTVWRMTAPGKSEKRFGKHPTQKPVKLIDRCLRASTDPGDLVLDPFAGSGSAGVAALAIGRRFVGIEMTPEYAEIARMRLSEIASTPPRSYVKFYALDLSPAGYGRIRLLAGIRRRGGGLRGGAAQHDDRRGHGGDGSSSARKGRLQGSSRRQCRYALRSFSSPHRRPCRRQRWTHLPGLSQMATSPGNGGAEDTL